MKIKIVISCFFCLTVYFSFSQNFELVDSISIATSNKKVEIFLYKRFPAFDNKNFTGKQGLDFKIKNSEKFTGPKSFSNYMGNSLFTIVSVDKKELVLNVFFADDLSFIFQNKTILLGKFVGIKEQIHCVLCRSVLDNFTLAVIKPDVNQVLGEFPNYFDSVKLSDWPVPLPILSEINIEEYVYITNIRVFQSDNEIIVYTEKSAIGNYDYLYKYYLFNIKKKQWYKAKPQAEIIETDSTYHLSKPVLKLTEIDKSDTVVKIIYKINKQLLKLNCEIDKVQAIREEDNILFFVEYKKKCKPVHLKYMIKEKEWYKVEFEKTEIMSD